MRILVTGGAGFIGTALVHHLLNHSDHRILSVDRLSYASVPQGLSGLDEDERHALAVQDIRDGAAMAATFRAFDPDAVVNLAAETHVDRSIDAPSTFVDTNVNGTLALLTAALGHWRGLTAERAAAFRFHHVSTDEVYGSREQAGGYDETARYAPSSPYAASKAAADHLVRAFHRTYGLPVLISGCTNNYGPRQFPEKLIPLMTRNACRGLELPLYGDGRQRRDWLHVDDHAAGLLAVLTRGRVGETYHLAGGQERANIEVVEAIADLVDKFRQRPAGTTCDLIRFVADRPGHDIRYALDATKAERELGWRPRIRLEDGLATTVAWYVERAEAIEEEWGRRYDGGRLGLGRTVA